MRYALHKNCILPHRENKLIHDFCSGHQPDWKEKSISQSAKLFLNTTDDIHCRLCCQAIICYTKDV